MVSELVGSRLSPQLLSWLLAAESNAVKPAILRMEGATRAKVLAVLAGLVILGIAMCILAWMGARMTRRYMNRGDDGVVGRDSTPRQDDWAEKPLTANYDKLDDPSA